MLKSRWALSSRVLHNAADNAANQPSASRWESLSTSRKVSRDLYLTFIWDWQNGSFLVPENIFLLGFCKQKQRTAIYYAVTDGSALSFSSLHSRLWSGQRDPANTTALSKHSGLGRLCSESISKSAFLGAPAWRRTHPPHFSPKAMSADFNLSRPREANSCRGTREKRRITAGYIFVRLEKYGRIKNFPSIFKTTKKMRSRFDILFTGDLNLLALCAF